MSEEPWEQIDKIIESLSPEEKDKFLKIGIVLVCRVFGRVLDVVAEINNLDQKQ